MFSQLAFRCLVASIVISSVFVGCSGKQEAKTPEQGNITSATSPIDGEWVLVYSKADGKVNNSTKPTQFKMFHNGFFSLIMQDSSGRWSVAGAGIFETNGNTYKETFQYCSVPEFVGMSDWQEFEIKGDTLYSRLFTKVTNKAGIDVSADWHKTIEEKRVRAKR